jgi:hypothetical protein
MDIVLLFLIVLFPGYLLTRYLYEKIDAFLILPLSFAFGLILLMISAMPSYIFRLDFAASTALIGIYSAILLFLVLKRGTLFKGIELKKDFTSLLLLILIVGATLMMVYLKTGIGGNDALFHLAQIRKLAENSPVSATEAVFPINTVSPAYGYNVWYFAIAITGFLAKIDVVSVWRHLVFMLLPISLLSLFGFASAMFKNRLAGITATVIYFFFIGFLANAAEFRLAPYPDQVARHILLFVSLFLFIQFINLKKRRDFIIAVLVAVSLAAVHLYSWIHFLIAVGAFSIVGIVVSLPLETIKNGLKVLGSVVLVSAPYLYFKLQDSSSTFAANERFALLDPFSRGWVFNTTIIILVYFALRYRKKLREKPWLIFLTSNALAGTLIVFNPTLVEMASKAITFVYTKRLLGLVYSELIFAAFIVFEVLRRFNLKNRFIIPVKSAITILLLTMIILIPGRAVKFNSSVPTGSTEGLLQYIKTTLPEKSVFAAGLWIGSWIPVYTNNYLVMDMPGNTTWSVDKNRRLADLTAIFSSKTNIPDTIKLLDEYDVSYIVISAPKKKDDVPEINENKFVNNEQFEKIYDSGGYRIYSYD